MMDDVFAASIVTRQATQSEMSTLNNSTVGFSVKPLYGKNQRVDNVNYWSLIVKPKQVVKLNLEILNGGDDHAFDINVNQAVTNGNLTVDYSKNKKTARTMLNGSLPIEFPVAAKVAGSQQSYSTIDVKKNTVVTVPIEVTVPDNPFDGHAVGGVSVTRHATASEKEKTINNIYNYTYAIVMAENKEVVNPDVSLVSLQAQSKQYDNTVTVNVKNKTNTIISNVVVNGRVTNPKGKIMAKLSIKDGTIVPLAKFGLVFRSTDARWADGKYHVKLIMTDKKNHELVVDQDIDIKGNKKQTTVPIKNNNKINQRLLIFVSVAIIILLGSFLMIAYRKMHLLKQ